MARDGGETPSKAPPRIAFLFLAMDALPHASLWSSYIRSPSQAFVHSFQDLGLGSPFTQTPLSGKLKPAYASIGMVEALLHLLETAYEAGPFTHFVTLSDSCIPFQPFDALANAVDNRSWMEWGDAMDSHEHAQRFQRLSPYLQGGFRGWDHTRRPRWLVSEAWFLLPRPHVEAILTFPELSRWREGMKQVYAPEEHFFINLLAHRLGPSFDTAIHKVGPTFVDWEGGSRDRWGRRHPKTYTTYPPFALSSPERPSPMAGYFFGRKFKGTIRWKILRDGKPSRQPSKRWWIWPLIALAICILLIGGIFLYKNFSKPS